MNPLSDEELVALMHQLESDRVEWKRDWSGDAPKKVRQAVCAFANDLPNYDLPGVVFVGINDDSTIANINVSDELLRTLADMKTDGRIVPPPTITVQKRTINGGDVAVVTVWPAHSTPVSFDGRIWIRIGPRRGIASAQDERILNEKRRHRDLHFEAHPVQGRTVADLNRLAFEQTYLPNAVAPDILEANGRTYEQRLASCGMIATADEPTPTVLGLLVVGVTPRTWIAGAYIQFLRVQGTTLNDPVVDESEIDGTIGDMLRRLDEKLKAHLRVQVDFTSQEQEVRRSPYPMVALQQIARNAVLHRTYEGTNAPVKVYWFDDRIEIFNPGGPFGSITKQNFGKPGYSDYRNPQLAAAFKVLGYAQRFGAGISIARTAMEKNGNPPINFEIEENFIAAILHKNDVPN